MPITAERTYKSKGGVIIRRKSRNADYAAGTSEWMDKLDRQRGAVLSSSYEYPGRYTRWDMALANPPLLIESNDRKITIQALNERGHVLMPAVKGALEGHEDIAEFVADEYRIDLTVKKPDRAFSEEERSRQPSTFSVVRALVDLFSCDDDQLGLYGAFGYDLTFQFEPIDLKLQRPDDQRDMVLFLPDEILIVDHYGRKAHVLEYDFEFNAKPPMACRAMVRKHRTSLPVRHRAVVTVSQVNMRSWCALRLSTSSAVICSRRFRDRCSMSLAKTRHQRFPAVCSRSIRRLIPSSLIWAIPNIWSALRPRCMCG